MQSFEIGKTLLIRVGFHRVYVMQPISDRKSCEQYLKGKCHLFGNFCSLHCRGIMFLGGSTTCLYQNLYHMKLIYHDEFYWKSCGEHVYMFEKGDPSPLME